MKLEAWIKKEDVTQAEVAKRLKVTQGFLSKVLKRKKRFSPDMAARVEKLTHGKVSFLELQHPRYRKAANE